MQNHIDRRIKLALMSLIVKLPLSSYPALTGCSTCKRKVGGRCILSGMMVDNDFGKQCIYHTERCKLSDAEAMIYFRFVDYFGDLNPITPRDRRILMELSGVKE